MEREEEMKLFNHMTHNCQISKTEERLILNLIDNNNMGQ